MCCVWYHTVMNTVTKNMNMTGMRKLAREADTAAKTALRNRFLIETFLSIREAVNGKTKTHASARALFKRLGI